MNDLLINLDRLHTTELGILRISRNLQLNEEVVSWCKENIIKFQDTIERRGKNWYISNDEWIITVNAHSYTIITAHKKKSRLL